MLQYFSAQRGHYITKSAFGVGGREGGTAGAGVGGGHTPRGSGKILGLPGEKNRVSVTIILWKLVVARDGRPI